MSTPGSAAHDKGEALELQLLQLFEKRGYAVSHNVQKTGRSGATHQIDVYAEYLAPLHSSRLVIESKAYDQPVDKDRVMKLMQIVDDIGADRGIIVTTSYFTPGAIKTAEGHNLDLWDRSKLATLLGEIQISVTEKGRATTVSVLTSVMYPGIGEDSVRATLLDEIERKRRGGFLGVGRVEESLVGLELSYYPFYEVDIEVAIYETEKRGLLSKETVEKIVSAKISVDGSTGELVRVAKDGIVYAYGYLRGLSPEEISVLRWGEGKTFTIDSLLAAGYSSGKAKRIIGSLTGKNLLRRTRAQTGQALYGPTVSIPDPRSLGSVSYLAAPVRTADMPRKVSIQELDASAIVSCVESYWPKTRVKSIEVTYYPFYICMFHRADGSKRLEAIDALAGTKNEVLSSRLLST